MNNLLAILSIISRYRWVFKLGLLWQARVPFKGEKYECGYFSSKVLAAKSADRYFNNFFLMHFDIYVSKRRLFKQDGGSIEFLAL